MKKLFSILSLVAFGLVFSGTGHASGTAVGSLPISATVAVVCTVSASPINFGNVDGTTQVNATGDVTVNCPVNMAYSIALDGGLHEFDAGDGINYFRALGSGTTSQAVAYYLLQPDNSTEWGDSDHANTYPPGSSLGDTGNGSNQTHTVNGVAPIQSIYVPGGTIVSDTVTVTVYY
jgi:spore coat protein U domain-containing protein, fimbrial subunit CupE1/2/3/6